MNVHANPETYGHVFGGVTVTVDREGESVCLRYLRKGPVLPVPSTLMLHSLDEVEGALGVHKGSDRPNARDFVAALKFAAAQIAAQRGKRK